MRKFVGYFDQDQSKKAQEKFGMRYFGLEVNTNFDKECVKNVPCTVSSDDKRDGECGCKHMLFKIMTSFCGIIEDVEYDSSVLTRNYQNVINVKENSSSFNCSNPKNVEIRQQIGQLFQSHSEITRCFFGSLDKSGIRTGWGYSVSGEVECRWTLIGGEFWRGEWTAEKKAEEKEKFLDPK